MNANSGELPKFELPPPPIEYDSGQEKAPETLPSSQENAIGKKAPVSSSVQSQVVVPVAVPDPTTHQSQKVKKVVDDDNDGGLTASEVDRIEKEWVDRAKAIVTKTRDDPYEQNSEMSKVKADYIKKRFNKTIPTDGTATA